MFGSIYAFTADGLTLRQLRDYVEQVRVQIRDVPGLGKIQMIGQQDEVIYLNFSTRKLAALGLDQRQVVQSLQSQNAVTPAGVIEAGPERISVRTSEQFQSEKILRPSTCGSTIVSTGSVTLLKSVAAMSIRRNRNFGSMAKPRSVWRLR